MKKGIRRFLIALVAVILVGLIGGHIYLRNQVHNATPDAAKVAQTATNKDGTLYFGKKDAPMTVIFYPGALIKPSAYSLWAKEVAADGYRVAIVNFPYELAVFGSNKADQVLKNNQKPYVIGGHSLGGVMASRYAANHQSKRLKGVFFLASYPDEKGKLKNLPVLSLTAGKDKVLNWTAYQEAKDYLPGDTIYDEFHEGNHAGFGDYGQQKGDGKAEVSDKIQQQWVAMKLISWLNNLK